MRWPAFLRIAASAGPGARLFHGAAALSKQLRVLEAQLGAVLIQRTTRRMSLTTWGVEHKVSKTNFVSQ